MLKARQTRPVKRVDQDVYTLALERTARVMDEFDHVYVQFSGGKDSTAVLNIALDVAHSAPRYRRHLPLRVVHYDEEAIPYETEAYVRRVAQRDDIALEWYCLPVKHRNACSRTHPWWWPWAPEDESRWCRPRPPEALTALEGFPADPPHARLTIPDANGLFAPPRLGNCATLMGIRAQESLIRRRAVTRRRHDNYLVRVTGGSSHGNLWKAYPVYDWQTEDVWTAPALRGWDYNAAYDRLAMAGLTPHQQRCSPAFGEEPLEKLHTYASCFPEVWANMAERVPGVGAAARYALTELYAYRTRPEKPAGTSWPEFIAHYLRQFRPQDTAFVADRIRFELDLHYRKTRHPIVVDAPHPLSGVSWNWLLMIAMRGDFKKRKQAGGRVENDEHGRTLPRYWHRYATELDQIIRDGAFADLACPLPPPSDPRALVPEYARGHK